MNGVRNVQLPGVQAMSGYPIVVVSITFVANNRESTLLCMQANLVGTASVRDGEQVAGAIYVASQDAELGMHLFDGIAIWEELPDLCEWIDTESATVTAAMTAQARVIVPIGVSMHMT